MMDNNEAGKLTPSALESVRALYEAMRDRVIIEGMVSVSVPPAVYAEIERISQERHTTIEHAYWIYVGMMD